MSGEGSIREAMKDIQENREYKMFHYLYFASQNNANQARVDLEGISFPCELRKGALGDDWLVLAKKTTEVTFELFNADQKAMESIAQKHNGEYDGWEVETLAD